MLRAYSFRPRGWTLALAALACLAFMLLGHWQSRRADAKRATALELDAALKAPPLELAPAPLDPAALVQKHVVARGRFVAEGTVLLANRLRHGRTGYEVVTPLKLARLPHALETGASSSGSIRQNLEISAFAAQTGLELEPLVIEQHSDNGDGLVRHWPRADLGIEKNQSYALQWYTFAALAIVLAVVFSLRRAPRA